MKTYQNIKSSFKIDHLALICYYRFKYKTAILAYVGWKLLNSLSLNSCAESEGHC